MRDKIIITPINKEGKPLGSDFRWNCVFKNRSGEYFWLTDGGTVVNHANRPPANVNNEITSLNIPKGRIWEIEVDNEKSGYDELVNFFKFNTASKPKGEKNPHLINALYEVEVESETYQRNYAVMIEKLHVANKLIEAEYSDLRDISYSIGTNPGELSRNALLVVLVGPTFEGDAMLKKTLDEKGEEILAVNFIRKKDAEVRSIIATVYKAVQFGVIRQENGVYMSAGRTMGNTIEQAISHAQQDFDLYLNWILPQVRQNDNWDKQLDDTEEARKTSEFYVALNERKKAKEKDKQQTQPAAQAPTAPVQSPSEQTGKPVISETPEPGLSLEEELANMAPSFPSNDTAGISRRNATNKPPIPGKRN